MEVDLEVSIIRSPPLGPYMAIMFNLNISGPGGPYQGPLIC